MATVELRFAALPGHVRTARMIAVQVARRAGVPAGALDEIRLAVGEACLRAVNVNRLRAPEDLVDVTLTSRDGTFTVAVADSGEPGDDSAPAADGGPLAAATLFDLIPAPVAGNEVPGDLDPNATGSTLPPGIGLALIEGLVDDLQVRRRPQGVGTVITMTWDTGSLLDPVVAGTATRPAG